MDTLSLYQTWLEQATEDPDLRRELLALQPGTDDKQIYELFYRELEFGTGGLRGILGAGTNRMNIYVIRRTTQGLCNYLKSTTYPQSVAIAYDSRNKGRLFAQEAAAVLAANGIRAWVYPRLEPTPALSWAVRHLGCGAGICITASHNPAKYNGYKVYGADGCQITPAVAAAVLTEIGQVPFFEHLPAPQSDDLIQAVPESCLEAYLDAVQAQSLRREKIGDLKVVYTPLNGAGRECVEKILHRIGVEDVTLVPEQAEPDGNFPTCPYPNPEIREAMERGLALCQKLHPDLLLGTDPDCDRMGVAVPDGEDYRLITGNEMGILLLDYICRTRLELGTMPKDPVAVTTIVSTDMVDRIAEQYGVELRRVLTGFKFIGEQIGALEAQGHPERYIFGFEESYGYLSGGHVRDKDAVNASMLCCEMTAWYRRQGMTLAQAIDALYAKHGCYYNGLASFTYEGADGMAKMQSIMTGLRTNPPTTLGDVPVTAATDYLTGVRDLPKADVVEFVGENVKVIVRPSGTEPKIKVYLSVRASSMEDAKGRSEQILKVFSDAYLR